MSVVSGSTSYTNSDANVYYLLRFGTDPKPILAVKYGHFLGFSLVCDRFDDVRERSPSEQDHDPRPQEIEDDVFYRVETSVVDE